MSEITFVEVEEAPEIKIDVIEPIQEEKKETPESKMNEITEILEKMKKFKELEMKAKNGYKQLETKLYELANRPEDGKQLHFQGFGKIEWKREMKIDSKTAKTLYEQYPDLGARIFSMTLKPKISEIDKIRRTIWEGTAPVWAKDFEEVVSKMQPTEKPSFKFESEGDEE